MVQLNQKQIQLFVIRPGKRIDQERSEGRFYALRRLRMEEFLALVAAE